MTSERDPAVGGGLATTAPSLGALGHDSLILPGVELQRFVVRERLGSGGMGVVYLAHDPTLERDVAVKLVHREAAHSDALKERLIREAKALSKVVHPNVVTVHEVGIADRDVFIVME